MISHLRADDPSFERTTVLVYSEFARTPKINGDGGRDHWFADTMMVFGSTLRTGVFGASNDQDLGLLAVDPGHRACLTKVGFSCGPETVMATLVQSLGGDPVTLSRTTPHHLDRQGAHAMRMLTIGLAALVAAGVLFVDDTSAQSPEICAPVERLDKYRYLRQLTLDLYGRIPTVDEYERLHSLEDVSEDIIDEMIGSEEFYDQLRRYHRNLLWTNLGDDDLVGQTIERSRNDDFPVWLNRGKRDEYRGRDVDCLDVEHTNFDPEGRPFPMDPRTTVLGECAGGTGCTMDGWVRVEPYWAPGNHHPGVRLRCAATHGRDPARQRRPENLRPVGQR